MTKEERSDDMIAGPLHLPLVRHSGSVAVTSSRYEKNLLVRGTSGQLDASWGGAIGECFLKPAMPWASPAQSEGSPESSVSGPLVIPVAWRNRMAQKKEQFSDPQTEAAVMRSLRWLQIKTKSQMDRGAIKTRPP